MSAVRGGEWQLLGYETDPVPADVDGLQPVIDHYATITLAMETQAKLLKKIGAGDETLLKGQAADAMRKRARESAGTLDRASGRYADVRDALRGYKPALEIARSNTALALQDAVTAAGDQSAAEGLADPVNADRGDDAPPLTDDDRQASANRASKIGTAKEDLAAAKAKAEAAMTALGAAADAAARKIRENWADDDLHTSGWDAFLYHLNKFLKKLVEILTYIGMALAVLSILIPGLGMLTLLSVVATAISVVASTILAAQGEGSWLSVIIGIVSLGLIGVAAKMAGGLKNVQAAGLNTGHKTLLGNLKQISKLGPMVRNLRLTHGGAVRTRRLNEGLNDIIASSRTWKTFADKTAVSPGWWQIGKPTAWIKGDFSKPVAWFKNDWSRITSAKFPGTTGYRWDRLIGISDIKDVQKINAALGGLAHGLGGFAIKPWMYIGPISYTFSWAMRPFSFLNPSNFNLSDPRWSFDGWRDADYSGLYGKTTVL